MTVEDLIAEVAQKTSGTEGDPLTIGEVSQVVKATLHALEGHGYGVAIAYDSEPEPDAGEA